MKEFLAKAEGSADLRQKMSSAKTADDLVKVAGDAGLPADKGALSQAMRTVAATELQKRGFPGWAVDSVMLGDAVCW
jgi:hypothetical protein